MIGGLIEIQEHKQGINDTSMVAKLAKSVLVFIVSQDRGLVDFENVQNVVYFVLENNA